MPLAEAAPVIIVGLDTMQGLQAARIFAGHGVPVVAIASDPRHYACTTNVCERIVIADTRREAVVAWLEAEAPNFAKKPVIVPCDDGQVAVISRFRDRLEASYHVPLPSAEVIELMLDKHKFYEYAAATALPIPQTLFVRSRDDAVDAASVMSFPAIIKPPTKSGTWADHTSMKGFKLDSADELLAFIDDHQGWSDVFIVQEWVPGPESELYSCNAYFDANATPLVTFVAKKLRQWPPRVGDSSLGVEVRNDRVAEVARQLFGSVGYRGLAYLEMKRDERSGELVIMEPNVGRPTGRSAIAEAGGVELLYTFYCDTVGWPLPVRRQQTYAGVKWINLRKDTQSALFSWRRKELSLRDWWRSWRGRKGYAVWSLRDPAPFVTDLTRSFARLIHRDGRRREAKVL